MKINLCVFVSEERKKAIALVFALQCVHLFMFNFLTGESCMSPYVELQLYLKNKLESQKIVSY